MTLRPVSFIDYANPAAGANLSTRIDIIFATDPATASTRTYQILSVKAALVTSAAVANRRVELAILTPGAITSNILPSPLDQTASLGWSYFWSPRGSDATAVAGTHVSLALPHPLIVRGDYIMRIDVQAIQAADQIQDVKIQVVSL